MVKLRVYQNKKTNQLTAIIPSKKFPFLKNRKVEFLEIEDEDIKWR